MAVMDVMDVMAVIATAQVAPLALEALQAQKAARETRETRATKETKETKETRETKDVMDTLAPLALLGHLTLPKPSSTQTGQRISFLPQRKMLFLTHQVQSSMVDVLPAPVRKYTYGNLDGITCITISITRKHASFPYL
jgi:hypothetical protein